MIPHPLIHFDANAPLNVAIEIIEYTAQGIAESFGIISRIMMLKYRLAC